LFVLDGHTLELRRKLKLPGWFKQVEGLNIEATRVIVHSREDALVFELESGTCETLAELPLRAEPEIPADPERVVLPGDPLNPKARRYPYGVRSLSFSPDGARLACGIASTPDGSVIATHHEAMPVLIRGKELERFAELVRHVRAIAVSRDGRWIAAGAGSGLRLIGLGDC